MPDYDWQDRFADAEADYPPDCPSCGDSYDVTQTGNYCECWFCGKKYTDDRR